jgi:phage protein U
MIVGALGDVVFEVSAKVVKTFDDFEWSSSAKYESHERHLDEDLPEYTGTKNDEISLSIFLSKHLGVDPQAEYTKLLQAERSAKVMPLVIGEKAYGKNKWVITKSKRKVKEWGPAGKPSVIEVSLTLLHYPAR